MDASKVDMWIMANGKNLEPLHIPMVRERMLAMGDEKWPTLQAVALKDSTTALIMSLLVGVLGVDRFYLGDVGLGIGKLLTCGGLGIWTIVDWFLIMKATREKNFLQIQTMFS